MILREVRVAWEQVVAEQMREVAEWEWGVAERTWGVAGQAIKQVTEEMADQGWASWELVEARQELETAGRE